MKNPQASWRWKLVTWFTERAARFRGVPEVTVGEVLEQQAAGRLFVLVDVRPDHERAVSVIPGAISVSEFEATEVPATDSPPMIAYCTAGYRSAAAAARWRKAGRNVINLKDGLFAWCAAGQPLETPTGEPTTRIHTYTRFTRLVPDDYEAVTGRAGK